MPRQRSECPRAFPRGTIIGVGLNRPYRVLGRRTQSAGARRPSTYSEECGYARTYYMHAARLAGRDLRLGSPEIDSTLPIRREARRERHDLRAGRGPIPERIRAGCAASGGVEARCRDRSGFPPPRWRSFGIRRSAKGSSNRNKPGRASEAQIDSSAPQTRR
jgi:hypothetical protein